MIPSWKIFDPTYLRKKWKKLVMNILQVEANK